MHVLVPDANLELARRLAPPTMSVHGFSVLARGTLARLAVRARLGNADWSLRRRWRVATEVPTKDVRAIWFPPEVGLSALEAEAILDRLPALRLAYWQRTGLDAVPVAVFAARDVVVENSRGLTSGWVAEAVVACIVAQLKDLSSMARGVVRPLSEHTGLFGQTHVAVLGTGRIGREVGRLCSSLGMRVTGLARTIPVNGQGDVASFSAIRRTPSDLIETAREADFLVLALPLTDDSRGSIQAQVLDAIGPRGTLINLARPGIVDQAALIDALRSRRLGAAYVSRLEGAGLVRSWRMRSTPNLFVLHDREAHVQEKSLRAAEQFLSLAAQH